MSCALLTSLNKTENLRPNPENEWENINGKISTAHEDWKTRHDTYMYLILNMKLKK